MPALADTVLLSAQSASVAEATRRAPRGGHGRRDRGERRGRKAPEIVLTDEEQTEFERVVAAGGSTQRAVKRARVILLSAGGMSNREIAAVVGLSENVVGKWRHRFRKDGPIGLEDAPRSGRPSPYAPEQKTRVIQKAIETPRDNGLPF